MDDFPAKIADTLEMIAARFRAMTVDRVRTASTWAAVGVVAGALGLLLVIYLIVGLFRYLSELIGVEPAYLVIGGLFLIVGALLWSKRLPKTTATRGADGT